MRKRCAKIKMLVCSRRFSVRYENVKVDLQIMKTWKKSFKMSCLSKNSTFAEIVTSLFSLDAIYYVFLKEWFAFLPNFRLCCLVPSKSQSEQLLSSCLVFDQNLSLKP